MLSPLCAHEIVSAWLDRISAKLAKWQKQVDVARVLMYRKDEPLGCVQRYFQRHSGTDSWQVRRFTGRLMARLLKSRLVCHALSLSCLGSQLTDAGNRDSYE